MATITEKFYVINIIPGNATTVSIMFSRTPNSKSLIKLSVDAFTVGVGLVSSLKPGDFVEVTYGTATYYIHEIAMASTTKTTKNHLEVYFYDILGLPPNDPRGLFVVKLSAQHPRNFPNVKIYEAFTTINTIIKDGAGWSSFSRGDKVYIEYNDQSQLTYVAPVEEATVVVKDISAAKPPSEWVNLCTRDMMFRCSGKTKDSRKSCHFHDPSVARFKECCHLRESMANACDCIKAHTHFEKYVQGEVDREPKKRYSQEVPDESYDKIMKKKGLL